MINVLFIIWSLERGGSERFLVALVKHLDRSKIHPVVCCLNWKGSWAGELEERDIEVIALNKKAKFDLKAFHKLVRIIKQGEFNIVNTHLWAADVFGRLAAIFAGVPIIISTAQNVDIWKKWWHRSIDRVLSYKTAKVIAVSEAVREYYHKKIGIPLSKIEYIPNAIEIERYENVGDVGYLRKELGLRENDFVIICVGRLVAQKGQRYLLEVVSSIKNKYPGLIILFAGSGEDEPELRNLASRLGVSGMVRFLGQRSDIPQLLHLSRVLVLSSLFEGLPLCVLEAMAESKPVIATDVGGTRELVVDNQTGFIVPSKDARSIANAIEKIIQQPQKAKAMGEQARNRVRERFSIEASATKTSELFLSLI